MTDGELAAIDEQIDGQAAVDDEGSVPMEKKKKKAVEAKEAKETEVPVDGGDADDVGNLLPMDFNLTKKKKKKKKVRRNMFDEDTDDFAAETAELSEETKGKYVWSGTDRDYNYDELLDRVYSILKEKNPGLTGGPRRTSMKPPQVVREGTRKTVIMNFADLCKIMNRNTEHVMQFLTAELGTTGSLDGQKRLVVKGRFNSQSTETVLRRYINEYVMCDSCKSLDTLLDRDSATRLMHLRCQQCGASRTVQAIRSGYVARVTRRQH